LKSSGVYAELCPLEESSCDERELRLSNLFVLGSSASVIAIVIGAPLMDLIGPKIIGVLGNVFFVLGIGLLASVESTWIVDLFPLAITLQGLGSGMSYIAVLNNSMLFKHAGVSSSVLSSCFDTSAIVFPLLFVIYYFLIPSRFVVLMLFDCWVGFLFILGWILFRYKVFQLGEPATWEPIPLCCINR